MEIITGRWSITELGRLIYESSNLIDIGTRIDFLSKQFIGTPYEESTLKGDINSPEVFVINLGAVDCFTFIDYVEAMRLSKSISEFTENLGKVRYQSGTISFKKRNHFFTDWKEVNRGFVDDVTLAIGTNNIIKVRKLLNLKKDGTNFIPGVRRVEREICYIPSESMNAGVIAKLETGDYVGIYSKEAGLDVSHVGIIIKDRNSTLLRHASSSKKHRKVVDEDFGEYISSKPGLIILRPKS